EAEPTEEVEETEQRGGGAAVTDPRGVLRQGRAFLDFFWDIAKPEQEVRLAATENLLRHLREGKKDDELKYTLKRLVEGLGATREAARPGFSLALAQVLQAFEEIPLCNILEQIKKKHNLVKVKKKRVRNAAFGNFFGVMALFQSGRLVKDRKALLESIQLLQQLTKYQTHLRDLPRKTLVDITSEVPETVFEEVLFDILQGDLSSAFTSPENLHLLLVGMQKFPSVLKPKKLKKLFGSPTVINKENTSRLVELLKNAAKSEKEDKKLPSVVSDLLQVALKEGAFELFWNEVVENGLLKEKSGPVSYMCYRLLGNALPLLSMEQLQLVLKGKVMLHYGEHVVATQFPQGFKFATEMEGYIETFLSGCDDPERQLAVMMGFSTLTNLGKPVLLSASKVVKHLQTVAFKKYVCWLKDMFLRPDLDSCLDFASNRQKKNWENTDILGFHYVPVPVYSRFCFFHAFFVAKKKNSQIAEASVLPSEPLNEQDHTETESYFFGFKLLLEHFFDSMATFKSRVEGQFYFLFLGEFFCSFLLICQCLLLSLFFCSCADNSEPGWVEVMVEILLSLLAQPSLLLRRISKSVFVSICPNLTKRGLQLILDVSEALAGPCTVLTHLRIELGWYDEDSSDSGDEEDEEVDDNFRNQLMKVLQAGNAEGDKSDEELDDDAMMALDKNISALFAEQQKRIQAKKDEKDKMRKEKVLRRSFKAKVLDLIDAFLVKQAENPLVFDIIEPLLQFIEQCMNSGSDKQEVDILQKTASIFKNSLCRNKQYCKRVAPLQEEVHALVQRLVQKACKHTDSAVALYYFSASLYLLKVLKGNMSSTLPPPEPEKESDSKAKQACCLNVEKVVVIYQEALTQFLSKRNSPLTFSMFHDLFKRFPVSAAECVLSSAGTAHGPECHTILQGFLGQSKLETAARSPFSKPFRIDV
uniref:MYB binding protein 1a n=1 Tax=Catharus ustulatus TaxID=91951 RepID=A0A8C3ULH0_CATUS